jgi:hypothetical protein
MKGSSEMDWTEQDKAMRSRLERQSSGGQRLHFAAVLNGIAAIHGAKEAPDAFTALNAIRKRQSLAGRSFSAHNAAHAEFIAKVAAGGGEAFNRLFPRDKLAAASAALTPPDAIGPDDARNERYTPNLSEARRLADALGRLASGDRRALDYWGSGTVTPVTAQWLAEGLRARIAEEEARQVEEAAADVAAGRIPLHGRR